MEEIKHITVGKYSRLKIARYSCYFLTFRVKYIRNKKKGCDKMLELEENARKLELLEQRAESLGESL